MPERRHVLLLEISYWRKILLESRLDFLKNKYVPLLKNAVDTGVIDLSGWDLTNHDNPETTDQAELFFQAFVRADPDIHKKNVQWMLNIVLSGKSFVEDLDKATQYLEVYEKVKRLLSIEQRDINKYKSFADLYTVIEPLQLEQSKRELDRQVDAEMHGQAEVLYNSATYKILTPLTKAAACYFGTNTQWCTAATRTTNLFDSYNNKSPLYIILDKANNRRWQYHFATGQFTNERDQQIDVSAFIIKYPEAAKALEDMLPKPILDWVEYNANVYRMPNGNIIVIAKLKNVQSILRSGSRILTVQVENNKLVQLVSHNVSFHPKDIAKLLNDQHIEGDRNNQFDLYYQDGRWQTVVEVAKPFLRFKDGWYWGRINQNDSYRFVLVP